MARLFVSGINVILMIKIMNTVCHDVRRGVGSRGVQRKWDGDGVGNYDTMSLPVAACRADVAIWAAQFPAAALLAIECRSRMNGGRFAEGRVLLGNAMLCGLMGLSPAMVEMVLHEESPFWHWEEGVLVVDAYSVHAEKELRRRRVEERKKAKLRVERMIERKLLNKSKMKVPTEVQAEAAVELSAQQSCQEVVQVSDVQHVEASVLPQGQPEGQRCVEAPVEPCVEPSVQPPVQPSVESCVQPCVQQPCQATIGQIRKEKDFLKKNLFLSEHLSDVGDSTAAGPPNGGGEVEDAAARRAWVSTAYAGVSEMLESDIIEA